MKIKGACVTHGYNVGDSYEVTIINNSHKHAPDPVKIKHLEKRR
jgi:hypothetical protein